MPVEHMGHSANSPLTGAMLRFVVWWRQELGALVPERIRRWWEGTNNLLLLTLDNDQGLVDRLAPKGLERILAFELSTGDGATQPRPDALLSRLIGHDYKLLLALPFDAVLRRTVFLPLAVEENLRDSLRFELDRFTPFKSDQAYFDFRVVERDETKKRLQIELAAVPRTFVDSSASKMAMLGLVVSGAVLGDQFATSQNPYRFLSESTAAVRRPVRITRRWGAVLVALVLLAAALAIPVWQKRSAAIALLEPLTEAKAAAEKTDLLRAHLEKVVHDYNFPIDSKWSTPSLLLVLEELSKLLPDDTYVSHMDFNGKEVQIQGESGSAAGLVQTLENSRMFKEVGFKSQLTKIRGTTDDRFHIVAVLRDARPPQPGVANANEHPSASNPKP